MDERISCQNPRTVTLYLIGSSINNSLAGGMLQKVNIGKLVTFEIILWKTNVDTFLVWLLDNSDHCILILYYLQIIVWCTSYCYMFYLPKVAINQLRTYSLVLFQLWPRYAEIVIPYLYGHMVRKLFYITERDLVITNKWIIENEAGYRFLLIGHWSGRILRTNRC